MEDAWIDRLIRDATERGELEPHEGVGEPIPDLDETYDPNWWVKNWIEREQLREYRRGRAPRWEDRGTLRGSSCCVGEDYSAVGSLVIC